MIRLVSSALVFAAIVMVSVAIQQVVAFGRFLDGVFDWLDLVFYSLIVLFFLIYFIWPIIKWRAYPTVDELESILKGSMPRKRKLLRKLMQRGIVNDLDVDREWINRASEADVDLKLREFYTAKIKDSLEVAKDTAAKCFALVAASQNSVMDSLFIIYLNVSMVDRIYKNFQLRDSIGNIAKFYRNSVLQASVTGLFESLDDEIFDIISSRSGEMLKKVPFADVVLSSVFQGFANGYMTLYYGTLAVLSFERKIFSLEEDDMLLRRRTRRSTRKYMLETVWKPADQMIRNLKPTVFSGWSQSERS